MDRAYYEITAGVYTSKEYRNDGIIYCIDLSWSSFRDKINNNLSSKIREGGRCYLYL